MSSRDLAGATPALHKSPALGGSFLVLIAGAVTIGIGPIFVRLSEVGPVSTALWRVALSLPLLGAAMAAGQGFAPNDGVAVPRGEAWRGMVIAGVFFAADLAFWHWSIRFTSVANSTMLANFAPVFVVLYAWLALGERITRRFLVAMAVALVGLVALVSKDFQLSPRALFGDALSLVTAVFYAGYQVSVKSLRGRFGTVAIMVASGLVTVVALLPVALASEPRFLPRTAHGWLMVGGLALFSHLAGQSLITYALAKLPASLASLSLLIQPVTAMLAAFLILHESVLPVQIVGMALVLVGVFLARQEMR